MKKKKRSKSLFFRFRFVGVLCVDWPLVVLAPPTEREKRKRRKRRRRRRRRLLFFRASSEKTSHNAQFAPFYGGHKVALKLSWGHKVVIKRKFFFLLFSSHVMLTSPSSASSSSTSLVGGGNVVATSASESDSQIQHHHLTSSSRHLNISSSGKSGKKPSLDQTGCRHRVCAGSLTRGGFISESQFTLIQSIWNEIT